MAEERMLITGGQRLEGTVRVSGGKNTRSRWRPEVGAVVGAQYAGDGVAAKRRKF